MAFLKRITPYAIAAAVLLLAAFYVRVPRPLRKTLYEHLQTFSLYRADLPSVQATPYEYLMFVVQWPFALCADREYCTYDPSPKQLHNSWHLASEFQRCLAKLHWKCFNLKEMRKQKRLQTDLQASWPNLECDNNMTFWKRECNKHGRCCHNIFKTAHKMWRKHGVEVMFKNFNCTPGQKYAPDKPRRAVRKETKMDPALRCRKYNNDSNVLLEVVICYNRNGTEVIDCPKRSNTILWKKGPN